MRPGDIIVVGPAGTTPAPVAQLVRVTADVALVQFRSRDAQVDLVVLRTMEHAPRGLAYSLFAPFPWQIQRAADLAVLPEMLFWYVALAAAGGTLIRERRRWRALFVMSAFAIGLLMLLSLAEGNVGSLYRHRAMTQPWILLLASPRLVSLGVGVFVAFRRPRLIHVPSASHAR